MVAGGKATTELCDRAGCDGIAQTVKTDYPNWLRPTQLAKSPTNWATLQYGTLLVAFQNWMFQLCI